MIRINKNYQNLEESYLFITINRKVKAFSQEHPEKKIIRLGIGDVTRPLCPSVIAGLSRGVEEQSKAETFRGYGPEQGYDFLRGAIAGYYKSNMSVDLDDDEIFISDGAKSDLGNILDIFSRESRVLVPDPVYPAYVDANIMDGREIVYADATEQNDFLPMPDDAPEADIIYICSPNNPTGAVYTREQLKEWVDYANRTGAVILFDAAYEAFITDKSLPRSIFEIEGSRTCAIEFCSLSKKAGFTGTRCGYTVVPKELSREGASLNAMWLRRQTTKFNGVSYIVQRGAAEIFTPEGERETSAVLDYYRGNAKVISKALSELGISFQGGLHSPYIWLKCPNGMRSWDFFDLLLEKAGVVGTPGQGFGKNGEGFFRLTAFGDRDATAEAMKRISTVLRA